MATTGFLLVAVCVCALLMVCATGQAQERIILDTDLGADCDDAGTFAVMHALADRGEIEIVAVGIVNMHENAVPAAHAINTWFGRPDVPIGTIKRDNKFSYDSYIAGIVKDYPWTLTKDAAPDVVPMYRRILAASADKSITLVTIGPASNISDLLDSGPDEISPLSGVELVRQKIKFYAAGGNGNGGLPQGQAGWNYQKDPASARSELEKMPTEIPMVFTGGSGGKIQLGEFYRTEAAEDHIIRRAYVDYFKDKPSMDRPTWDQLRMLFGCRPAAREMWEVSAAGDIRVDEKVQIRWTAEPNRNRAYGYVKDIEAMKAELKPLMLHDPRK